MPLIAPVIGIRATHSFLRLYYFVAFGALGLYIPFFPSWLHSRGFMGFKMSALVALLPLCQLAAPSLIGMLADKWGLRGRMMSLCATATAIGMSGFTVCAIFTPRVPFGVAWLCMLVFAALRGPSVGLADVLAMETAQNYGRMRVWGTLGFMSLAYLGGQIIEPTHQYQLPLLISIMLWLLVLVSRFLPKTSHLPPRPALIDARSLFLQPSYRHLLSTMVLIFSATSAYDLCATLHLTSMGASIRQIGTFWTIAPLAEVGIMLFASRLIERVGPGKLLTLASLTAAGRWFFLARSHSLNLILWMQPLHAISYGLMWVSAIGVLKRELGTKGTATAHGLFSSSIAIGSTLGLLSWGIVFEDFGGQIVFCVAALIALLATLSASRLIRLGV